MAKRKLRKPILGIDQLSDETSLLSDDNGRTIAFREGTNIDLDTEGNCGRRQGQIKKLTGSGYHSLYESKRGWLMLCNKQELGVYNTTSNSLVVLANMEESQPTSFAELNGNIYYMNPGAKGMIRANEIGVRTLGVDLPKVTPSFTAAAGGSFEAGKYGIAYSIVDDTGEESPLGPLMVLTITERSSIQGTLFTTYPNTKYRVYITSVDGEELYQAVEFDADVISYLISDHGEGRQPATQYLSNLPFGYILRAHGSRLYVATNDFVFFSEPFLPHLTNAANGFIPVTGFVTMVQPVETGIFIGDQTGVRFYSGDDPEEFQVKDVSSEPVVYGTAVAVPGEFLPGDMGKGSDTVAIWLAPSGYQVGMPSGEIIRLHTKQVQLPRYVQGCAAFSTQDGRKQLITPVNSNELADVSVALDSTIG